MKRPLATGRSTSRIWIAVGASLVVVAVVLLVLALLQPGSAAPGPQTPEVTREETAEPTTAVPPSPTPEPSPTTPPAVASVNGYTITQEYLDRSVALNGVLSDFAGQQPLGRSDTLRRLIMQQLVLQGAPHEVETTDEEVDNYIVRMQEAWNVEEDTMISELEAVGVDRDFLNETIHRLLTVQKAAQELSSEGHNVETWLSEQQEEADIEILESMSGLSPTPSTEPENGSSPSAEPTATPEKRPSPTPEPEQADIPDVAPDFTLKQAGGGTFTLQDQLAEGPVVLVFFERCG